MQCSILNILRFLVIISYLLLSGTQSFGSQPSPFSASLTTSLGITPDPKKTQTSLGIEPNLKYNLSETFDLQLYSSIDRPMDPYQNFSVPVISLTPGLKLPVASGIKTKLSLFLGLLDVDQLKSEGVNAKLRPTISLSTELLKDLSVSLRLGPYYQFTEYKQTTAGNNRVRYGFNEKLAVLYKLGNLNIEVALILDQKYSTLWKNDYATSESIEYLFNDVFSLGVGHTVSNSVIDESTGFKKKPQFFDARQSRFSLFMGITL